jgi:hypothetical protein
MRRAGEPWESSYRHPVGNVNVELVDFFDPVIQRLYGLVWLQVRLHGHHQLQSASLSLLRNSNPGVVGRDWLTSMAGYSALARSSIVGGRRLMECVNRYNELI